MVTRSRRVGALLQLVLAVGGCSFSPLAHRIDVGREPFVIFVGEGADRHTDLFAVSADGGTVAQVTFTTLAESDPRLSPSGDVVAFIRTRSPADSTSRNVVVMNLLSGGELTVEFPANAGTPDALAWSRDGSALYIRTTSGLWRSAARPGHTDALPVPAADSAPVDTVLDIWLGQPRFARAVPCSGSGLCIIGPRGDTAALAPAGRDAMRWGDDSVGWFEDGAIMVRSLGPGRERKITWAGGPSNPREGSFARGTDTTQ